MPPRRTTRTPTRPARAQAKEHAAEIPEPDVAGEARPRIVVHVTEFQINLGLPFVIGGSFFSERPTMSMLRRFMGDRGKDLEKEAEHEKAAPHVKAA